MRTLTNKIIVITGAGGTIAGAVEEAFVSAGARPILVDRDRVRIEGRARSYATEPIEADMHSLDDTRAMIDAARRQMGRIDGLVHLVGDVVLGRLEDADEGDYALAFDTNVRTLAYTLQAALPVLRECDEAFIGGIAAREAFLGGAAGFGLFAAAKSAVATLLRSVDQEVAGSGIGVGIVTPMGVVDTVSNRRAFRDMDPAQMISPDAIGDAFVHAALSGEGGRLLELPIHPPVR